MFNILTVEKRLIGTLLSWCILFGFGCANLLADTCAQAKIQIDQDLAFERQAFEARMTITNGLPSTAMTDFQVTVLFMDKNKQPVVATTQANATGAKFYYSLQTPTTLPTSIAGGATQSIAWLIIPSPGAGGSTSAGNLYLVGANLQYKVNGVAETVALEPDAISVMPMPDVALEYFLPVQVIGDDPHTTNIVEPSEPFALGVRVVNLGAGIARSLTIDSGQPKIVDNLQNLLVRFQINGCQINGQTAQPTLLANFGDVQPQGIGMGLWSMTASLTGRFSEFTATFTHADELGGAVTSLVRYANTYDLIGTVLVDLPGRDSRVDFLGQKRAIGAPLTIHESDQVEAVDGSSGELISQEVVDFTTPSNVTVDGGQITVNSPVAAHSFGYVQKPDIWAGAKVIRSVTRPDGKRLLLQNAWFSKTQSLADPYGWSYFINIFDSFGNESFASSGALYYLVEYATPLVNHAPVLAAMGESILKIGGSNRTDGQPGYRFTIRASDADGDPISLHASALPVRARFTAHQDGTGCLDWTPGANQAGGYSISFQAFDGKASDNKVLTLTVTAGSAIDSWKKKYFGDETDPNIIGNQADPDADGLSNLLEYALGLDPTKPDVEPTQIAAEEFTVDGVTNTYLTLTYVKRLGDPTLTFSVLGGNTLKSTEGWSEQNTPVAVSQDEAVPAGFERVKVRDSQPIEGGPERRYLKLEVSIPD